MTARREVEQASNERDGDQEAGFEREARPEATEHGRLALGVGLPVLGRVRLRLVGIGGRRHGRSGRLVVHLGLGLGHGRSAGPRREPGAPAPRPPLRAISLSFASTIDCTTWPIAGSPSPAAASSCSAPFWARAMTAVACARAHSSVCSTSARAEFVSSVAWWRDCSSSRLPRVSASRSSRVASAFAFASRSRASRLGGGQDLGALALRLGPVALDLGLALLQLVLLRAHLLLGALELRCGGGLGVALERVGELGGGADQVQRVHPDGVPGRLDVGGLARRLEHAELRLQLGGVAAEGVERLADALLVVAVAGALKLLHRRKRGQPR